MKCGIVASTVGFPKVFTHAHSKSQTPPLIEGKGSWSDGSPVKSSSCSYRVPKLSSLHSSQLPVTPAPEEIGHLWPSRVPTHVCACTHTTCIHACKSISLGKGKR